MPQLLRKNILAHNVQVITENNNNMKVMNRHMSNGKREINKLRNKSKQIKSNREEIVTKNLYRLITPDEK